MASLWKRWLAAAINGLAVLVLSIPFLLRRREASGPLPCIADLTATVLSGAYHVTATRFAGQTLGQRAVGIRVVNQETGDIPTGGQATLRWAITTVPEFVSMLVHRSLAAKEDQALAAVKALEPEVNALKRQHGADQQGLNQALMQLYKQRGVNPTQACLPSLLGAIPGLLGRVVLIAPALRAPLHQGLHDGLAKTVVIRTSS
jgi:uncharacterized RDD family membrane protein YckC